MKPNPFIIIMVSKCKDVFMFIDRFEAWILNNNINYSFFYYQILNIKFWTNKNSSWLTSFARFSFCSYLMKFSVRWHFLVEVCYLKFDQKKSLSSFAFRVSQLDFNCIWLNWLGFVIELTEFFFIYFMQEKWFRWPSQMHIVLMVLSKRSTVVELLLHRHKNFNLWSPALCAVLQHLSVLLCFETMCPFQKQMFKWVFNWMCIQSVHEWVRGSVISIKSSNFNVDKCIIHFLFVCLYSDTKWKQRNINLEIPMRKYRSKSGHDNRIERKQVNVHMVSV